MLSKRRTFVHPNGCTNQMRHSLAQAGCSRPSGRIIYNYPKKEMQERIKQSFEKKGLMQTLNAPLERGSAWFAASIGPHVVGNRIRTFKKWEKCAHYQPMAKDRSTKPLQTASLALDGGFNSKRSMRHTLVEIPDRPEMCYIN
jgi:hypothetical protein